jgi:hypothetical protein
VNYRKSLLVGSLLACLIPPIVSVALARGGDHRVTSLCQPYEGSKAVGYKLRNGGKSLDDQHFIWVTVCLYRGGKEHEAVDSFGNGGNEHRGVIYCSYAGIPQLVGAPNDCDMYNGVDFKFACPGH